MLELCRCPNIYGPDCISIWLTCNKALFVCVCVCVCVCIYTHTHTHTVVIKYVHAWFLILCCYLSDPQLFFVLFCDSCSWCPCLSWTVKLPAVLQKNPWGHTNSLVFQHLLRIWTLFNNDDFEIHLFTTEGWQLIFLKNSRQLNCSGQTRDSWATTTKMKKQANKTAVDHQGNST